MDFLKKYYQRHVTQLSKIFNGKKTVIDCILSKVFMFNAYTQLVYSNREYYTHIPLQYRSDPLMVDAAINSKSGIDNTFYLFYRSHLKKYRPTLSKNVVQKLGQYGDCFCGVPVDMYTQEMCLKALTNYRAVEYLRLIINNKPEYLTTQYQIQILNSCSHVFEIWRILHNQGFIKDESVHIVAFEKGVMDALQHISNVSQTVDMWAKYCKSSGRLNGVPPQFLTKQLYIDWIISKKNNWRGGWDDIPQQTLTKQFALDCVTQDWETIKSMKAKFKLKKLCTEALRQCPFAIEFIPKRYKTKSVCENCFERNIRTFKWIPDEHKTEEMCIQVIRGNVYNLWTVPKHCLSKNIILEAIKSNSENFNQIPKDVLTLDICLYQYAKWCTKESTLQPSQKADIIKSFKDIQNESLRHELFLELLKKDANNIIKHIRVDMEDLHWKYVSSLTY